MIRYQTANERAFQATLKALQTLQKLQDERERKSGSNTIYVPDFSRYDKNDQPISDPPESTDQSTETDQNDFTPPKKGR